MKPSFAHQGAINSSILLSLMLSAGLVFQAQSAPAQSAAAVEPQVEEVHSEVPPEVSLELVMAHPDWLGNAPESPYWSDDNQHIYFQRKRAGFEDMDLYRVATDGTAPLRLEDEELASVDVATGDWAVDRLSKTYIYRNDLYVKDLISGKTQQLTRSVAVERQPRFMKGNRRIVFQRQHNAFMRDLDNGLESQLVDLRLEDDPAETPNDSYLQRQQLRLLDIVRQRHEENDRLRRQKEERHAVDASLPPIPWYLGEDIEIISSTVSPSGDWMALVVNDAKRDDGRKDQMPNWVNGSGYVESLEVRAKVGTDDGSSERLWILDLKTRTRHEIDLSGLPGISQDPLAELKARAAAEAETRRQADRTASAVQDATSQDVTSDAAMADKASTPEKPRPVRFEDAMHWSQDGQRLLLQVHSHDNKDRWIGVISRQDLELRPIHHLQQEGWINWYFNEYGWLPDGRSFYFLSEESGYSQLYWHDLKAGTTHRLTQGDYVVSDPVLEADGASIYFTANIDHPGIYEVYRTTIGKQAKAEQITRLGGRNTFALSPNGTHLAILHSTTTRPPELFVQSVDTNAQAHQLTHTVSDAFTSLDWVAPEVVAIPSTHQDQPIYSRYYPPSNDRGMDASRRPAVVFVHGAGYLQNSHQGWSGYFREFMFHTLLSQHGYAVLDMDYRASAGYGVAWREAIYRQMGTPELEDLQDGVDWLVEHHGVDADRVGVYGGSYGGFLTMMALFKEPDLFACGAALRPVTDWAHYNHPYTSNILNTPDVDPWAYERSSPIELAEGLTRPLLICAPMQDDNVFFQDTVRLAQRLIELEKEDWEVAIFPVEPHGFRQPSSWLDEYRRIFKLFEEHLQP